MDHFDPATERFRVAEALAPTRDEAYWDFSWRAGPVLAFALHDGHRLRESLRPHMAIAPDQRRREEDPLTGLLLEAGDVRVRLRHSRFEVDLNRPRHKAMSPDPADTWGLPVWHPTLLEAEMEQSRAVHDRFYAMAGELVQRTVKRWGCALVLDLHSYNHRRDGIAAEPAAQCGNPDLDLGATTLDRGRWGGLLERFTAVLREHPMGGRRLDIRENIRYPTGGHFPEWLYATFGGPVCTITCEYKKVFMDEWSGLADIGKVQDLALALARAVDAVRPELAAQR